jgi:ABC-2 type transport system permease protein
MSDVAATSSARVLTTRALRLTRRTPDALVVALTLPVLLMLLFVYLFGGALDPHGHYVDYVVPGVLLLCASFGASTTAVAVCGT